MTSYELTMEDTIIKRVRLTDDTPDVTMPGNYTTLTTGGPVSIDDIDGDVGTIEIDGSFENKHGVVEISPVNDVTRRRGAGSVDMNRHIARRINLIAKQGVSTGRRYAKIAPHSNSVLNKASRRRAKRNPLTTPNVARRASRKYGRTMNSLTPRNDPRTKTINECLALAAKIDERGDASIRSLCKNILLPSLRMNDVRMSEAIKPVVLTWLRDSLKLASSST